MTPPSLLAEQDTFWTPAREEAMEALILNFPERRRVAGLHGFAQSGKDTVAGMLKIYGYEQVVLAQPILDALVALNAPVAHDSHGRVFRFAEVLEAEGYEGAKKTVEFRRQMQVFGTEIGRDMLSRALGLPSSIWIEIARNKISGSGKYAISDVRFLDEVDLVRQSGGVLIKVKRPGYGPVNDHKSDAGLPDELFDIIIDNDGTLEDLHAKVREHFGPF